MLSNFRRKDDLQNHTNTICDFLKEYSASPSAGSYYNITRYIVARSWYKMERRITHWTSLSFCVTLSGIDGARAATELAIETFFPLTTLQPSTRKDSNLRIILSSDAVRRAFPIIINAYYHNNDKKQRQSHLDENPLHNLTAQLDKQTPNNYNFETCIDFHRLLVGTLRAYRSFLIELREPAPRRTRTMVDLVDMVWLFGMLLYDIAYSKMLLYHLQVLSRAGILAKPHFENKAFHERKLAIFSRKHHVLGGSKTISGPNDSTEVEDGSLTLDEMNNADGLELEELVNTEEDNLVQMYRRWIQLQVNHWAALRNLIEYSRRPDFSRDFSISIVNMSLGAVKMTSWDTAITNRSYDLVDPDLSTVRSILEKSKLDSSGSGIEVVVKLIKASIDLISNPMIQD
jgi:hypothetical protein